MNPEELWLSRVGSFELGISFLHSNYPSQESRFLEPQPRISPDSSRVIYLADQQTAGVLKP